MQSKNNRVSPGVGTLRAAPDAVCAQLRFACRRRCKQKERKECSSSRQQQEENKKILGRLDRSTANLGASPPAPRAEKTYIHCIDNYLNI